LVSLRIGNRNIPGAITILKAHQARALAGRESTRSGANLLHENFRSILVVSGRKRPRHTITTEQAVAKAVTGLFMLGPVVLQILPQMLCQSVLLANLVVRLEDAAKRRPFCRRWKAAFKIFETEATILAKSNDENAFAFLRNPGMRADCPPFDLVAKLSFKCVLDNGERAPLVMPLQVLDVFK